MHMVLVFSTMVLRSIRLETTPSSPVASTSPVFFKRMVGLLPAPGNQINMIWSLLVLTLSHICMPILVLPKVLLKVLQNMPPLRSKLALAIIKSLVSSSTPTWSVVLTLVMLCLS